MPSNRRLRLLGLGVVLGICLILWLSSDSSSQEFYSQTVKALDKKKAESPAKGATAPDAPEKSKVAAPIGGVNVQKPIGGDKSHVEIEVPKQLPPGHPNQGKAPGDNRPKEDKKDIEKSVAGRKTMKGTDSKKPVSHKDKSDSSQAEKGEVGEEKAKKANEAPAEKTESKEDHEVETEINTILKKGPIIIFSKSYCAFSAKAKRILLEKYSIVPAPYVVELDQHPLGAKLQAVLEKMTGRRTVPNILINGKSIGGGDDIEALDKESTLIDKVKTMGGKRITEVKVKEEQTAQ